MIETDIYTVFKDNKQLFFKTLARIEALFDKIAMKKETQYLLEYDAIAKDTGNIRTAVTYRYDCIRKIMELESKNNSDERLYYFASNHIDFQNAYLLGIMLLRRFELPLPDYTIEESITLLKEHKFSIYFYLVILNNELFEKKWLIANKVFDCVFSEEELPKRIDILNKLSLFMKEDDFLLRAADLSLEANEIVEAITFLKKIKNPSFEIISLLEEMETNNE